MGCRRRCRVRDRESAQMVVMKFLTVDDRYCFSAAAQAELSASFARCPCGCYELGGVDKLLLLQLLLLLNPLRDGSVYSSCSFTPSSVLLVLLFLAALHAHNILMYYEKFYRWG